MSNNRRLSLTKTFRRERTFEITKKYGRKQIPWKRWNPNGNLSYLLAYIKTGLYRNDKYIFCKKELTESMKTAIISMTPKKDPNDTDIAKWRPILLLCVDYKIITKALANRLLPTLDEIISIEHSAAVPNRTIYFNLFTIRDVYLFIYLFIIIFTVGLQC